MCHATQEKTCQIGATLGAHDDRVRVLGLGDVQDSLGGTALRRAISPAPGVDAGGGEVLLDPFDEAVGVRLLLELPATPLAIAYSRAWKTRTSPFDFSAMSAATGTALAEWSDPSTASNTF